MSKEFDKNELLRGGKKSKANVMLFVTLNLSEDKWIVLTDCCVPGSLK